MKKISFKLVKPTTLVPLNGDTMVDVESTGSFNIVLGSVNKPRQRDVIIQQTECARLYQTPSGTIRKVVVTLPTEEAEMEHVIEEVKNLYANS